MVQHILYPFSGGPSVPIPASQYQSPANESAQSSGFPWLLILLLTSIGLALWLWYSQGAADRTSTWTSLTQAVTGHTAISVPCTQELQPRETSIPIAGD